MKFYTQQHSFYCGIDLHARTMYLCILSSEGKTVIERNIPMPGVCARRGPLRDSMARRPKSGITPLTTASTHASYFVR